MDNSEIHNKEKTWDVRINSMDQYPHLKCPDWADLHAKSEWGKSGIVIWSKPDSRIICLWPHQALDVLDDLRESSSWKNEGLLLSWNSYSLPFSEKVSEN